MTVASRNFTWERKAGTPPASPVPEIEPEQTVEPAEAPVVVEEVEPAEAPVVVEIESTEQVEAEEVAVETEEAEQTEEVTEEAAVTETPENEVEPVQEEVPAETPVVAEEVEPTAKKKAVKKHDID